LPASVARSTPAFRGTRNCRSRLPSLGSNTGSDPSGGFSCRSFRCPPHCRR
jgi:hypothetical protein